MKTIVFNYGRLSPFDEPNEHIPSLQLEVKTFRYVWGNVGITLDGDLGNEHYLESIDGCFYYDGIFYSDLWVEEVNSTYGIEEFDPNLYKIPKTLRKVMERHLEDEIETDITSQAKHSKIVAKIIGLAKRCDGETMQYILEQSAQDEQMLKQLLATRTSFDRERYLANRLELIKEELAKVNKLLDFNNFDVGESGGNFDQQGQWLGVYLDNIAIACDLEDSESDNWIKES